MYLLRDSPSMVSVASDAFSGVESPPSVASENASLLTTRKSVSLEIIRHHLNRTQCALCLANWHPGSCPTLKKATSHILISVEIILTLLLKTTSPLSSVVKWLNNIIQHHHQKTNDWTPNLSITVISWVNNYVDHHRYIDNVLYRM